MFCVCTPFLSPSALSFPAHQVHGVELDGVFLGVPFRRHCDGQSLTGDGEELGLRRFQLVVVQVYFKASWGIRAEILGN